MPIKWNFRQDGELINDLKTKAYRNPKFLAWLRQQKCYSCPAKNDITASHLGRGYHGLKNHDHISIPMCGWCHWEYEYHREFVYEKKHVLPTTITAEKYFQQFLRETGLPDDRTPEQIKPL